MRSAPSKAFTFIYNLLPRISIIIGTSSQKPPTENKAPIEQIKQGDDNPKKSAALSRTYVHAQGHKQGNQQPNHGPKLNSKTEPSVLQFPSECLSSNAQLLNIPRT
ncbi:hypothetical protein Drorol1_Dr00026872 [Drosera rotundifolia]